MRLPSVGQSPKDVVFRENKWRLLRYRGDVQHPIPVLLVPSLINRHYVLDLVPGRSFTEFLVAEGFDVYTIDWGTPGPEDRFLTFDTVCDRYVGRAIRQAAKHAGSEKVHLLGYCLGGTIAAIHAALHPERIASFVALAAPIQFRDSGLLSVWTRTRSFDIKALVRALGNVPWPLMQASFHLLRPTNNLVKAIQLIDKQNDDAFLEAFLAVETWSNDNVSFPGECYRQYIEDLYQNDRLLKGTLSIGGRPVELARLTAPTLCVTFAHDHIVPSASAKILMDLIGAERARHVELRGGHVGAVVSKRARHGLWPAIAEWFRCGAAEMAARPSLAG